MRTGSPLLPQDAETLKDLRLGVLLHSPSLLPTTAVLRKAQFLALLYS